MGFLAIAFGFLGIVIIVQILALPVENSTQIMLNRALTVLWQVSYIFSVVFLVYILQTLVRLQAGHRVNMLLEQYKPTIGDRISLFGENMNFPED